MKQAGDDDSFAAAAAEPSRTLSIKVPAYHTCHAWSIKAAAEITQL